MSLTESNSLPIDESARRRFEQAWRESGPQAIEQFLPEAGASSYLGTLFELAQIDLELCWKAANSGAKGNGAAETQVLPRVESYLARFPQLNDPRLLLDLIREEYSLRERYGGKPSPSEYRSRFPQVIRTEADLQDEDKRPTAPLLEIPGYQIIGILGEGGMGIVYHARQLSLNREVALKVISAGPMARAEELARFRAEAEAVAQLQDPNIVQIYEIGDYAGRPFLSLEFVEGQSLAQRMRESPISTPQAAKWTQTLAIAMHHVHQRGIIHRDLKPANVMIRTDGVVKITDFGLAKRFAESAGQTLTGSVVGTPSYSPPEQAAGRTRDASPLGDIYSIGAILYEMLTGRPPFRGESAAETLLQVMREEPVSVARLRPGVSKDLETICHKCLQKEPGKRYQTAEALAEDLRRFLAGEPISARPVGNLSRLWRWSRRNRALAASLTAAAIALIAAAITSTALAVYQTHAARIIAEKQLQTQAALDEAHAQRLQAENLSSGLVLDQALALCQQGDVKAGLLWMARSLTLAPAESQDLQWAIRAQMNSWSREVTYQRVPPMRHQGGIVAAAFSRDGSMIITGSDDRTARLWDAATGNPASPPLVHHGTVRAVAFSPDRTTALTASEDGTAQLWGTGTGAPIGEALHHDGPVLCAIFSPDGKLVATGSADETARLWDAHTGRPNGDALRVGSRVTSLAFTPDSQTLATATRSGVRLWQSATGTSIGQPLTTPLPVQAIAISPDGKLLAAACGQTGAGNVQLWDLPSGQTHGSPLPHPNRVTCLAFDSASRFLLTGCDDGIARRWDTASAQLLVPLLIADKEFAIRSVAISRDGKTLAAGSGDSSAYVWDADTGQPIGTGIIQQGAVQVVGFGADRSTLLTASEDKTARLWNIASGQSSTSHPEPVPAGSFDHSRKLRLIVNQDGEAVLEDAATGKPLGPPLHHDGASPFERQVTCAALSPDGRIALTGGRDQTARLWDAASGKPLMSPVQVGAPVGAVAFAPDGRIFATGSDDKMVRLWDVATGHPVGTHFSQRGVVSALAFSPDGTRLLTASAYLQDRIWHGQGRLWDISTGTSIGQPLRHAGRINAVAFSPDGKVAATASDDRTAQFWEAATARPMGFPLTHPGAVTSADFLPDGTTFITTCSATTPATSQPATSSTTQPANQQTFAWQAPHAITGTPAQLQNWSGVITGLELDNSNIIHRIDDADWLARRQQLHAAKIDF